jgi:hypothetical protein
LKVKRVSRNEPHKIYGYLTFFQGITKDDDLLGELYEKQGGEYRKTVYKLKENLCSIIETDDVFYPSIRAAMDPKFTDKVSCIHLYSMHFFKNVLLSATFLLETIRFQMDSYRTHQMFHPFFALATTWSMFSL